MPWNSQKFISTVLVGWARVANLFQTVKMWFSFLSLTILFMSWMSRSVSSCFVLVKQVSAYCVTWAWFCLPAIGQCNLECAVQSWQIAASLDETTIPKQSPVSFLFYFSLCIYLFIVSFVVSFSFFFLFLAFRDHMAVYTCPRRLRVWMNEYPFADGTVCMVGQA